MEVRKGGKEYFNKSYIKHHPEYLFIFEDTLEDEEFENTQMLSLSLHMMKEDITLEINILIEIKG